MSRKLFLLMIFILFVPFVAFANEQLPPEFPAQLAVILGVIAPFIVQPLVQKVKRELARLAIAILLSAIIGVIGAIFNGLPLKMSLQFIVVVFTFGQAAFNTWWKPVVFEGLGILGKEKSKN